MKDHMKYHKLYRPMPMPMAFTQSLDVTTSVKRLYAVDPMVAL